MPEVPHAGEQHRDAVLVAGGDAVGVAAREPPGWTIAVTPAAAAASTLSRNGKNASDASTLPFDAVAGLAAPRSATESTRLICPAPTPTIMRARSPARSRCSSRACRRARRSAERRHSASVGLRFVTHLPLVRVVGPDVAGLHEQAAVDAAVVEPLRAAGRAAPVFSRRTFSFHFLRASSACGS